MDQQNANENEQNIHQRLMEGYYQQNTKITTNLFAQLLKEFKLYYLVAIMMNLLMCALFTVQYFRQCNDPSLTSWMLYSSIVFFMQFIFYGLVIYPSFNQQQSYYFAEQLNEVVFEGDEDPYYQLSRRDRTKKRKRIENLIRSHFKNYKKVYWYIDMFLTISDLGLVALGIAYFSMNDYFKFMFQINKTESFSQDCEFSSAWITFWSIVLLCISRKNAFQLLLLVIICDDHSCSICRMDYTMGASIKVLPCSNLHHFHSTCIKAWFRISPTCPLCRKELGKIIDDIRSNNGAPSYLILDIPNGNSQINQDLEQQINNENNNMNQNVEEQYNIQQISEQNNNDQTLINQIINQGQNQ